MAALDRGVHRAALAWSATTSAATACRDWDTPELSLDAFVDDLETRRRLRSSSSEFDLLAISQGAAVAIAYAVRHPERVRRLVICNGYAAGWAVRGDPEEMARREAMLTLTEIGWGADNPAYRQLFTSHYVPDATPKQMGWFNEMQRLSASPENAVRLQRALASDRCAAAAAAGADADADLPFARATRRCRSRRARSWPAGIPGARFVPLESRNHILLESEPAWRDVQRA